MADSSRLMEARPFASSFWGSVWGGAVWSTLSAALHRWERTPDLLPQVWGLREDQAHPELARAQEGARAEIVDIRPHVEVRFQLALLHGGRPRPA